MNNHPIFNKFYRIIERLDKKMEGKKDNEFIEFKLNSFIEIRNELLDQYSKSKDIIYHYKRISENRLLIEKEKIKKTNKLKTKLRRKKKRNRLMILYEEFPKAIRCFDRKTCKFNKSRNSYKKVKKIKEEFKNKEIKFKVKTFKVQTEELKNISKKLNNHINFFLYEFPEIQRKFDKIEYIKKY